MAHRDESRRTYRITFPAELDGDQVVAWINAISGALQAGRFRLGGVPTLAIELWASDRGLAHRLRVPVGKEEVIVTQLRSLLPGVRAEPEGQTPGPEWTTAVELGQRDRTRLMRIHSPEMHSASLLASVQPLRRGELVVMQWMVSTAPHATPPAYLAPPRSRSLHAQRQYLLMNGFLSYTKDDYKEWSDKASEVNMLAVLRMGAKAGTANRAEYLLSRVMNALKATSGPRNSFKRRMVGAAKAAERINEVSGKLNYPGKFAASELAALLAWPIGQPHVAGLPQGQARQLPANASIPKVGRVFATSNMPGDERPLAISVGNSAKHLHVCGPTGTGKTALLANLAAQDMQRGAGVVVMEPKGDLFEEVLRRVPRERVRDVVIIDVTDTDHPVGFNILRGNPQVVAADIQRLFEFLYPNDVRGVRVRQGLYHAIMTLMTSHNRRVPMTFADIGPLCSPRADQVAFSDNLIKGVRHDEELAAFWQDVANLSRTQRDQFFGPLLGRIWQLNNRREVRHIIGQSQSTIDLGEIIRSRKILLVNLAGLGQDVASLLGSLLLNNLWTHVQAGAANPRRPTFLYLDEFQDFLNLPVSPETMLAQARSRGLAMNLAHQHLEQLPGALRAAVMANARSKVVFQASYEDARLFAREFGGLVTVDDFMNLGQFEVIARVATDSGVSNPVTAVTNPPFRTTGNGSVPRAWSRQQYSRPVAEVEAEIRARRQVGQTGRRRPRTGGQPIP